MTEPAGTGVPTPRSAAGDEPTRLGGRTLLVGFALVLGASLLLAAVGASLADAPDPPPECAPGTECGGPPGADADAEPSPPPSLATPGPPATSTPTAAPTAAAPTSPPALPRDTVGIRAGVPWRSADHGFEFEFSDWWSVDASDGSRADLVFQGPADAMLIVDSVPTAEAGPDAFANRWFDLIGGEAPDLRLDTGERNAILGPGIGFVDGIGRSYAGTWTSPQAATVPIGVGLVTASDGRTTVAVVLIVWNPDATVWSTWGQHAVRGTAELVLKTFRWGSS